MARRKSSRSRSPFRRRPARASAVDELRAAVVDVHGEDDPVYCFVRRHGALPGAALLHLAAYDADPAVRAAALALVDAAAGGDSVLDELGGAVLDAALEVAPGIADDPEADEDARRLAAALLRSTGLDEPDEDPTAALVAAARAVEDSAASVEALLETAGLIQEVAPLAPGPDELERALALGRLVAQGQPDVGATLLAVLAAIAHEHGHGSRSGSGPSTPPRARRRRAPRGAWTSSAGGRPAARSGSTRGTPPAGCSTRA